MATSPYSRSSLGRTTGQAGSAGHHRGGLDHQQRAQGHVARPSAEPVLRSRTAASTHDHGAGRGSADSRSGRRSRRPAVYRMRPEPPRASTWRCPKMGRPGGEAGRSRRPTSWADASGSRSSSRVPRPGDRRLSPNSRSRQVRRHKPAEAAGEQGVIAFADGGTPDRRVTATRSVICESIHNTQLEGCESHQRKPPPGTTGRGPDIVGPDPASRPVRTSAGDGTPSRAAGSAMPAILALRGPVPLRDFIIQEIPAAHPGGWRPSPGWVYPMAENLIVTEVCEVEGGSSPTCRRRPRTTQAGGSRRRPGELFSTSSATGTRLPPGGPRPPVGEGPCG